MKTTLKFFFVYYLAFVKVCIVSAQYTDKVWCFGDSAGIQFTSGTAQPISTTSLSRGGCNSITDSVGELLFYTYANKNNSTLPVHYRTVVTNKHHQIIANGDSLHGSGWYQESVIVPQPAAVNKFYFFTSGVTASPDNKLYYSYIDMSANNDSGQVVVKNQVLYNDNICYVTAVKHGNGRDWWLITHDIKPADTAGTNIFISYLITPDSISGPFTQAVGTKYHTTATNMKFSNDGTQLACVNVINMIELYNFNRCTGLFTSYINIEPEYFLAPIRHFYSGCEFSLNGRYLYTVTYADTFFLSSFPYFQICQYDLTAFNISSSKQIIFQQILPASAGDMKRGADGRIYITSLYNGQYPYQNNMYNMYNNNLGVINDPDSASWGCNFQAFSYNLGSGQSYWGLPNNPNYSLGPLLGSSCDSLPHVSVNEIKQENFTFSISPNPTSGNIKLMYLLPQNKAGLFEVFDVNGKRVYSYGLAEWSTLQNFNLAFLQAGVYNCSVISDGYRVIKKLVVMK